MSIISFAPEFKKLPKTLPVFPLTGVLLLPGGQLPLNIFEPRYLSMIESALASDRLIGMIQPRPGQDSDVSEPDIYDVGCAGKITIFNEMPDGRYEIKLSGISRFRVKKERRTNAPYRVVKPDWSPYEDDLIKSTCLNLNRDKLLSLLKTYFAGEGMECDWGAVESATDGKLITCLSMACPFEAGEKQALLEAPCSKTRADKFMAMLEIAAHAGKFEEYNKH